ncbi:MAG: Gfo/Idh/MocA family oxidoreductase [Erysipelotrichaceae bacterium]|nr:Gfo/Idh/MocA family oxidoreductase [Erysipelotrichaceae bacterium]
MKLAIFGCGNIAKRIASSCKLVDEIQLVGFASKDLAKAKEYSEAYECEEYGDYDYFLNSDIDAVYIAVYNPGHYELIRTCLEHGKSVICEKPMLASIEETQELFALAKEKGVTLMEALKSVFLPLNIRIKKMIQNKELGEVKELYASFMRCGHHPLSHWINDPKTGGAFKDLGCYCIGTMNYLMDEEPKLLEAESDATDNKADSTAYVKLKYGDVMAKAAMSNSLDGDETLIVTTDKGYIRADHYWKSGSGYYVVNDERHEIEEECISDFYYELKHFAYLVDNKIPESPIMNKEASIRLLKITAGEKP